HTQMCPEGVFFIGPEHDGHTGLRSDEQVRTRAIADSLPANQPTVCVNGRIPGLKAEYRQRTRCPQVVGESLWKHSLHESSIAPFLPKSNDALVAGHENDARLETCFLSDQIGLGIHH